MRFKPLKPHKYRNNSNKMNSNIADQHETIKSLINMKKRHPSMYHQQKASISVSVVALPVTLLNS